MNPLQVIVTAAPDGTGRFRLEVGTSPGLPWLAAVQILADGLAALAKQPQPPAAPGGIEIPTGDQARQLLAG